jgi:hypothetical protein
MVFLLTTESQSKATTSLLLSSKLREKNSSLLLSSSRLNPSPGKISIQRIKIVLRSQIIRKITPSKRLRRKLSMSMKKTISATQTRLLRKRIKMKLARSSRRNQGWG